MAVVAVHRGIYEKCEKPKMQHIAPLSAVCDGGTDVLT